MENIHKSCGLYEQFFKRLFDILFSLLVIICFWWLYIFVAIFIRIKLGSPILFVQERPGKDEKIFELYKFRSMSNEKDNQGNLLPDVVRLTKFGKLLRSTSLDELPELFNILKGDMSVVGPRPLLKEYLSRYNMQQARRHEVRPGLTGLAQVNGRNGIVWEEKLQLDVEYIDNITFLGDLKIVLSTIFVVLKRNGITSETSATMEKFRGDNGFRDEKNVGICCIDHEKNCGKHSKGNDC